MKLLSISLSTRVNSMSPEPDTVRLLREFVKYLRSILGCASLICTLLPPVIAALGSHLTPPWPGKSVTITISSGLCAFVVLALFFGIRHQSKSRKRVWGSVLFALTFVAFAGWIYSNAFFVVTVRDGNDGDEHRVIRGFSLQEVALEQIENKKVSDAPVELLKGFGENSPEIIWTHVALAKMLVFVAFVLPFAAAAGTLSAFALQDFARNNRPNPGSRSLSNESLEPRDLAG